MGQNISSNKENFKKSNLISFIIGQWTKKCEFIEMPNEIIEEICKYLSPNDLAALSLTCRSINKLVKSYFQRKIQCGIVKIELNINGQINRCKQENYEKHFCSIIDNVQLNINTNKSSSMRKLLKIVKTNCTKRIRCLALDLAHYNDARKIKDFEIIADQLENLKLLFMHEPPWINGILKHCKQLQILCVIKTFNHLQNDNWTNIVYTNLKVLILVNSYCSFKHSKSIDLIGFLLNTRSLQAIALNNYLIVRSFLNYNRKLSYAALWFRDVTELFSVWNQIERMCKQHLIESLHLGVGYSCELIDLVKIFKRIQHLTIVKSFHFTTGDSFLDKELLTNIPIQLYLQKLCIRISHCKMQHLDRITELFPNLQELYICDHSDNNEQNVKGSIKSIASQHRHLKRFNFTLNQNKILILNDDLIEMNVARSKLIEPSFLAIQTNARSEMINTKLEFISIKMNLPRLNCLQCKLLGPFGLKDYEDASAFLKTLPADFIHSF